MLTNDTFVINNFYLIDPLLFTHLSGHKSSIAVADWTNLIQHFFKCIFLKNYDTEYEIQIFIVL